MQPRTAAIFVAASVILLVLVTQTSTPSYQAPTNETGEAAAHADDATASPVFVPLQEQSPEVRRARRCEQEPTPLHEHRALFAANLDQYLEIMRCLGVGHSSEQVATVWNDRLQLVQLRALFPSLLPLHGGVPPAVLVQQARHMALLLGMDRHVAGLTAMLNGSVYRKTAVQDGLEALGDAEGAPERKVSSSSLMPKDVVVELGCGNAGLLFLMCPPVPDLACFGADFAPRLIAHGQHHIPWIDLRVDIFAPHLPTGSASGVLSHGVLVVLTPPQACGHLAETLRLLRPRGRAVLWVLTPKPFRTTFHPSFFHEGDDGTIEVSFFNYSRPTVNVTGGRFLQFCQPLGRYVRSMRFIMSGSQAPLFIVGTGYFFGVVVERSDKVWTLNTAAAPAAGAAAGGGSGRGTQREEDGSQAQQQRPPTVYPTELPLAAYRKHAQRIEPIICEQEGLHRYSDAADGVPSLLHYMTLANTTALHRFKSRGPYGKYWSVEQGGKKAGGVSKVKKSKG